jgi:two-component system, chemotaxis family, chemotaxis protein CheY
MRFSAASVPSTLKDGDNPKMTYPISITRASCSRSTRDRSRSSMVFATAVGPGIEPHRSAPPKRVPWTQLNGDRKEVDTSKFVLIVDDDPNLLEVTSFVLESEGMAVETAKNGEEALASLRAGRLPVLVLLDLMMPVMNGWEFLDEVAKDPSLEVIPVVVLTAIERAQVPGTVEVLRKPMDLTALLRVVERYVRGDDDAGS